MAQITKRALAASLKSLLLKKPFNKITVEDIASDCGVSRMTFYYYFSDIYNLVEWTCQEDAKKALAENRTYGTWQQGFLNIFRAVEENRPFILNVYHSVSREHVERYLYQVTYGLLIDVVEEKAAGMRVTEADKTFLADFYKYAFVGIMLDWIQNNMKTPPETIIERMSLLLHGNITRALRNYEAGGITDIS